VKSTATMLAAIVVSLGIWTFFYEQNMPLTTSDTVVVVGASLVAVLFVKWVWARIRNKAGKEGKAAKDIKTVGVVFLAFLLAPGPRQNLLATSEPQGRSSMPPESPVPVACSPETPVVPPDGSVVLKAWVPDQPAKTLRYTWVVTAGTIGSQGREVRWDLKGTSSGIYEADVKVEDGATPAGTCSIRIVLADTERGTGSVRATARTFLLKGQQEAAGYGLYSYLLLGSHPTETTLPRYQRVVQAYLGMIDDIAKFENEVGGKLNITYVPLETAAPEAVDAPWVLQHYDYARTRLLLDALPGDRKAGIYLVSSLKPLSSRPNPPYMVQDLSSVPAERSDLISWWLNEFQNQAAQERFWEPRTAELFVLKLRTTITVLATGLPDVQRALGTWITSIH